MMKEGRATRTKNPRNFLNVVGHYQLIEVHH